MSHLDFKHEFIATDPDTWGPEIDMSDDPRQCSNKPPETPNLETSELIETFKESIKEMTNLAKVDSKKQAIKSRNSDDTNGCVGIIQC